MSAWPAVKSPGGAHALVHPHGGTPRSHREANADAGGCRQGQGRADPSWGNAFPHDAQEGGATACPSTRPANARMRDRPICRGGMRSPTRVGPCGIRAEWAGRAEWENAFAWWLAVGGVWSQVHARVARHGVCRTATNDTTDGHGRWNRTHVRPSLIVNAPTAECSAVGALVSDYPHHPVCKTGPQATLNGPEDGPCPVRGVSGRFGLSPARSEAPRASCADVGHQGGAGGTAQTRTRKRFPRRVVIPASMRS